MMGKKPTKQPPVKKSPSQAIKTPPNKRPSTMNMAKNIGDLFNEAGRRVRRITTTRPFVQASVTIKMVGLSGFVTFFVFFMIQVIWGSEIAGALPETITTVDQSVFWVELLLLLGLFTGFGISMVVSIVIGEQQIRVGYDYSQRRQMVLSTLLAFVATWIILTFVAFVSMTTAYPEFLYNRDTPWYTALGVVFVSMLKIISYFVIYIFPRPTEFWLITIAMYFIILTIAFIMIVPPSLSVERNKRKKRVDELKQLKKKGAFMS
jgi:hypothetical protein